LVAIDEFQRLLEVNPSSITQLQRYWDVKGSESKAFLILSGSNVGMIKKIFHTEGAPLFKRASYDLMLKPLHFSDTRKMLNDFGVPDIEEQIKIYSVFGGVPYYYALLYGKKISNWQDAVRETLLNPLSPLKNEVRDTMVESFGKDHPSYYAIINAIAIGKTKKKEIADFAGIRETSISPYLYDLENLVDIIDYEVPVTEKKPWRSRRGHFVLKDNLFRFWFRYIFRNMSHYEKESYEYLMTLISDDFDLFNGPCFEEIAKEFLLQMDSSGKLPFRIKKLGRWWNRSGEEIDFVLLPDRSDTIVFVECKWNNSVNADKVLGVMIDRAKLVEHNRKEVSYVIISRGFKSRTDKALCFDITDIDKALG
jgi:AAA+ ATPase superfamily predicted ATPase